MTKAAQRQFLVTVKGIPATFAQKSGGERTSEASKGWDGGSEDPFVLAGPASDGDLTLTRPYDPERDQEILTNLRSKVGKWLTTVSIQPLYADMTAVRVPPRVHNALLIGVREPEVDASSGEPADFELTFAVGESG